LLFPLKTGALFLDDNQTLEVVARLQTRTSLRLQDSEGFTSPSVSVGNLVQWRNLAMLEIDHDLGELTQTLDVLYPLHALDIRSRYRLVGRFLYEAVYNVGPQAFQDTREADKENIDSFKEGYDLWECYADFSRGPAFLRLGRQNLAWGETDIFRLLDYINPLDNTFGGPFEDLDDRRIPLWMLRGSYNFGTLGPVSTFSLEGFWVPGTWDARVAPLPPGGTPYAPPAPSSPLELRVLTPDKTISSSRWGARLMGVLAGGLQLSLAHYSTFLDTPAIRVGVTPGLPVLMNPADAYQELSFPDVQVTGAAMNYWQPQLDVVLRAEAAWFWDEPVFIPQENLKLSDTTIALPPALVSLLSGLAGTDLAALGLDSVPINPTGGTIPEKNIFRYMIGFDKQVWIRPLNGTSMFLVSMQYFAQWIQDFDARIRQPLVLYPDPNQFAGLKEYESVFTTLVNTTYRNGTIMPQMAVAYDVRGAWLVATSASYILEPFRFGVAYSAIMGNFTNFGAFRDRDQITFTLTYLLN
jgi:hypothetical protein